METFASFSGWM